MKDHGPMTVRVHSAMTDRNSIGDNGVSVAGFAAAQRCLRFLVSHFISFTVMFVGIQQYDM